VPQDAWPLGCRIIKSAPEDINNLLKCGIEMAKRQTANRGFARSPPAQTLICRGAIKSGIMLPARCQSDLIPQAQVASARKPKLN
jgi:hypothetical protein